MLGILAIALIFPFVPSVQGQNSLSSKISNRWQFRPPINLGVPTGREGGATRGCDTRGSLLPIVPDPVKGLTISANPAFYWYLPPTEAAAIEFSLRDDQDQELYKTRQLLVENSYKQNGSGKIMGLQLSPSDTFTGLEIGREYVWEVVLICDLDNPTQERGTIGIVERITPSNELVSSLQNTTTQQQLEIYLDANLWYETVDSMIDLHRESPTNPEVAIAWQKLMESVDLPEVVLLK